MKIARFLFAASMLAPVGHAAAGLAAAEGWVTTIVGTRGPERGVQ